MIPSVSGLNFNGPNVVVWFSNLDSNVPLLVWANMNNLPSMQYCWPLLVWIQLKEITMFLELMELIISGRNDYSCDSAIQQDLSCKACDIETKPISKNEKQMVNSELFQDPKQTSKGVSPFVGQMFGSMNI